ncbi:RNA-binding S4 domain-containing protein [Hyphomicrobium sp.]|uniref:RNA-binding S4 domain-containing protein n=1 Tax=Hyphomicrobium sp. TaxID=82 RepID=UPI003F72124C
MTETVSSGGLSESGQRLDKWLWFARVTKSRTVASAAVIGGKIKVNRETVTKASHPIKPGDVITSRISKNIRVLRVVAPGTRRGPAPEARLLYEDMSPPVLPRSEAAPSSAWAERAPGSGRPTKRERRKIDAFNDEG